MSLVSNPHTVSIASAPSTTLGIIAAAMPPRSWVYLDGTTQNGVVCTKPTGNVNGSATTMDAAVGASGGNTGGNFPYANKGRWNPVSRSVDLVGKDHGMGVSDRYSWFDEVNHVIGTQTHAFESTAMNHNFDMSTTNPATGEVIVRAYGNTGTLYKFPSKTSIPWPSSFQTIPDATNIMGGIDWWTGAQLSAGAQGLLLALSTPNNTVAYVNAYDPVSNAWVWRRSVPGYSGQSGTDTYHSVFAYSAVKNVAIFGGTNTWPNQLWKIDSTATITKYAASTPIPVGITRAQIVDDPITGNFLVNSASGFYEFNPDGAGTWTLLSASPSTLNKNTLGSGNGAPGVIGFSLSEHSVVGFISSGSGYGRMHLYKHG